MKGQMYVRVGSAAREDGALFTLLLLFGGFGVDETCRSSWAETGREMLARLLESGDLT